jgi:hypothetical protein
MSSLDRLNFFTRVSRYEYLSLQSTQAVFLKSSGLLEICQNMSKYVKICQNMSKYVKICQNMSKYVKIYQNISK